MCGRYTVLTEDEIIEIREIIKKISLRIVRDDFDEYEKPSGEVCPTDFAPVITAGNGGISFESAKWGFKKWDSPSVIINARSETMRKKSLFSKHLETGRCVIPAGEFFEWEKLGKGKRKYYAKDRKGNILFMAGLYRDVKNETEAKGYIREFVIITKNANGEMAKIHDRVPVILTVEQIEAWLTGVIGPEDVMNSEYDITVNPCENEDGNTGFQVSLFDKPED